MKKPFMFKKMATVHLPQYLENLTQPIGTKKAIHFVEFHLCTNGYVYGKFGVVRLFVSIFMSSFRVFVC